MPTMSSRHQSRGAVESAAHSYRPSNSTPTTKDITNNDAAAARREKNALLDYYARRTVHRGGSSSSNNVKQPPSSSGGSPPPKSPFSSPQAGRTNIKNKNSRQKHTVYIQNSSALAKREQEMLRKGALARNSSQGGDTVTTRSLTTATSSQQTLHTTFDNDNESSFEYIRSSSGAASPTSTRNELESSDECLAEDASSIVNAGLDKSLTFEEYSSSSDDEIYEEESTDDEREWKRDGVLLDILCETSDDDQIYEDNISHSSSSSSGYVSDPRNNNEDYCNDEDDNNSMLDLSVSSLNSSAWRMDAISEDKREIRTNYTEAVEGGFNNDFETATASFAERNNDCVNEPMLPCAEKSSRPPPVAVVFEIDDYTDDSAAMGEDTLLQFVKDFTEEMKDEESVDDSQQQGRNDLPGRSNVKVYSTVGTRRCDLKTMKQRVLSSETIVSTILENRVKQHRQRMSDRASLVASSSCRLDPLVEESGGGSKAPDNDGTSTVSLLSNSSSGEDGPDHCRKFSKDFSTDDILSSILGEDILLSSATTSRATESSLSRLQEKKRAREAIVSKALLATTSQQQQQKQQQHSKERSRRAVSSQVIGNERALTDALKEEAERRRQRIKNLRAKRAADTTTDPIKEPTMPSSPSIASGSEVMQQASVRPIMQGAPLQKNESISTGMLTVPTSNLSTARLTARGGRQPVVRTVASKKLPEKKRSGFSRFLGLLAGSKNDKSDRASNATTSRTGTVSQGYRDVIAARRQNQARYSTPSRMSDQSVCSRKSNPPPLQAKGRRVVSATPHPLKDRSNNDSFATSIEPRRLFDDDSISYASTYTTPASMGQGGLRIHCSSAHLETTLEDVDVISYDELAASTALASASWV